MKSKASGVGTVFLLRLGWAALICLAAVPGSYGQTITATISAGLDPAGIAVNPVTNKIYVANLGSGTAPPTPPPPYWQDRAPCGWR
jgi:hypothetical protein